MALLLLGRRELSEAQLRARLARRGCTAEAVDAAVSRLRADGTLDDARVARVVARYESRIRHRGPARVRQRLTAIGVDGEVAARAVAEAFAEMDPSALLDAALDRRLHGRHLEDLDDRTRARLVRALLRQGFAEADVLRRVRRT